MARIDSWAESQLSIELQSQPSNRKSISTTLPSSGKLVSSLQNIEASFVPHPAPKTTEPEPGPSVLSLPISPVAYDPPNSKSRLFKAKIWWSHNIRLTIPWPFNNGDPRDYLALERTYLAYIRTSSAIVSLGVVIIQLFILKNVSRTTGVVLAATLCGGGIIVVLVGCFRFFRQQGSMNRGKALCAGWDMVALWAMLLLVTLALFIVVLIED